MSADLLDVQYDDPLVLGGFMGFPEIRPAGPDSVIVSTWDGHCLLVNTATWSVENGPDTRWGKKALPVGMTLRSLSVSTEGPVICAVATRATWACLWVPGETENRYVVPTVDGPVNAVALAPRGDRVAIGTGCYPLDPKAVPRAHVELWTTDDAPQFIARRRLPGVVVDCTAWSKDGATLIAVTGAITQDRGHLVLLDGNDLQILDIAETDDCGCANAWLDATAGVILTVHRHAMVLRCLSDFGDIDRRWDLEDSVCGADYLADGQRMLLSSGALIDVGSGETHMLPPLPRCSGVAFQNETCAIGISRDGAFREWRLRRGSYAREESQ